MDNNLLSLTFTGNQGKSLIVTMVGLAGQIIATSALTYGETKIGPCQGGSIAQTLHEWQRQAENLAKDEAKAMFGPLGDGGVTCVTLTSFDTTERIPSIRTPDTLKGVTEWVRFATALDGSRYREAFGPLLEGQTASGKGAAQKGS